VSRAAVIRLRDGVSGTFVATHAVIRDGTLTAHGRFERRSAPGGNDVRGPFGGVVVSVPVRQALAECEATIERGLATFREVGAALLRIRDERLYRNSHTTFEEYVRERWGFSKPYAHRQIQAAEIAGVVPVGTERQARELAPVKGDPEQVREAWAEANRRSGGKPTAADVRESRRAVAASHDAWAADADAKEAADAAYAEAKGKWKRRRAARTERDADKLIKRAIRAGFTPDLLRGALDRAFPVSPEGRPATPDEEALFGRALSLLDDDDGAAS
jgi:hypothetical protein